MTNDEMVPNRPTPEGIRAGRELARVYEAAAREVKAEAPALFVEPCATCAFRRDTLPNGCEETVMDALKAVIEGDRFMCHHKMIDGEPTKVCAGWMTSRAVLADLPPTEAPWPYSHEITVCSDTNVDA